MAMWNIYNTLLTPSPASLGPWPVVWEWHPSQCLRGKSFWITFWIAFGNMKLIMRSQKAHFGTRQDVYGMFWRGTENGERDVSSWFGEEKNSWKGWGKGLVPRKKVAGHAWLLVSLNPITAFEGEELFILCACRSAPPSGVGYRHMRHVREWLLGNTKSV